MQFSEGLVKGFLAGALICSGFISASAQTDGNTDKAASSAAASHSGQHDFDFELGTWNIHLKRRLHPLTGSNTWVEFDGLSSTQKVWDGRSQIEQFETSGSAGHIEGLTLRLFNPETQQWSLYWANARDGIVVPAQVGQFKNGVGEFYAQDTLNGKLIFVRFVWSKTNTDTPHFEQAFSDDGGKTWEVNWITDQTRISEEVFKKQAESAVPKLDSQAGQRRDGQHDFDFETGSWKAHLKRLDHPLTGSNTWIEYDGTSVVKKLWNGRANFGELELSNPTSQIEGLTLRLYNPKEHQWRLYWANSKSGVLTIPPTTGQYANGRGEFFDQEDLGEKAIFVRFVFSDIAPNSFLTEQAFSADGSKTWEPNWIGTFTRE
jgi:hypothetical protein